MAPRPTEKLPGLGNHIIMAGSGHKIWLGIGMMFLLVSMCTVVAEGADVGNPSDNDTSCGDDLTWDSNATCKKTFNGNCTDNSSGECANNLVCTDEKCVCITTHYWDDNNKTCKMKKTFNGTCTIGVNEECGSNLKCTDWKCVCNTSQYWDSKEETCKMKLSHQAECPIRTECEDGLECTARNSTKYCLCDQNRFWYSQNNTCLSVDSLKVYNVEIIKTMVSVTLTWDSIKYESGVKFGLVWNSASREEVSSPKLVDSLNPGTEYNYALVAYLSADIYYDERITEYNGTVTTKSTINGTCSSNDECGSNLKCSEKKCVCDDSQYWNNSACQTKSTINGTCSSNDECGSNLKCSEKKCVCDDSQYWNNSACQTKSTINGTCSSNDECGSNLKCSEKKCVCDDSQYWNDSACQTKSTINGTCSSNDECGSNLKCFDEKCVCDESQYWNGSACQTKLSHEEECTSGNECKDDLICTSYEESVNNCLCHSDQFWNKLNNSCQSVESLKVYDVKINKTTDSVTLTWDSNTYGLEEVQYDLVWDSAAREKVTRPKSVPNLIPGRQYNYSLLAYLIKNSFYHERSTTYEGTVATVPAQPGSVLSINPMSIEFEPSDGDVEYYIFELTPSDGESSQNKTVTTNKVEFDLKNSVNYNYVITAYNSQNNPSEPRTGSFKTNPAPSTPVTSLTLEAITSNNVTVTWTLPDDPKGDITEFFVQVYDEDTSECIQFYNVSCSNCTQASNQTTSSGCRENFAGSTFTAEDVKKGSDHVFTQQITSLDPFKFYKVNVYAFNNFGEGENNQSNFTTLEDKANNIASVNVTPGRDDIAHQVYLNVTLFPGIQTGLTNFTVTLINASVDSEVKNQIGYSDTNVIFTDLMAYHNYRVSAYALTKVGRSPNDTFSEIVRTSVNKPGIAMNLRVEPDSMISTKFTLTLDCPPQNNRNGTVERVNVTKILMSDITHEPDFIDFQMPHECTLTLQSDNLGSFTVSQNYSFSVTLQNEEFISDPSAPVYFFAAPKPPIFEEESKPLIESRSQAVSSETSIEVRVDVTRLTNGSQGEITIVGLIVCIKSEQSLCDNATRTKRSTKDTDFYSKRYTTWAQSQAGGFINPYRATPQDWLQNSSNDIYTIGSSSNCQKGDIANNYCNGPLPSGRDIVVTAFSCTSGGCAESKAYVTRTKASDSSDNAGLIAGVVVGVVLALVIAVLIFVVYRRRRRSKKPDPIKLTDYPPKENHSIPIRKFKETVARYHKDANLLFQDEFEDIKTFSSQIKATTNAALKEENRVKNRYVDILPYDHSRVKLQVQEDNDDYINANYIPGFNSPREYIATQGPMHATIPHFWRMVWEQKNTVIVMLSDLTESNKLKVSLYWPENLNEPISYGEVLVEMTNFSQLNKYIIRNFRISFGNQSRRVTHFFIPGWWDFSANLTFNDVLEFAQLVRKEATPPDSGPVVVHCSAGVGRTGTFIALDYFMQYIDKHGLDADIDIFSYVMSMRKNRPRMVQAEAQYIFIFDALVEVIQRKLKAEQEHLYDNGPDHTYKNISPAEENIYVNTVNGAEDHTYSNQAFVGDSDDGSPDKPTTVL